MSATRNVTLAAVGLGALNLAMCVRELGRGSPGAEWPMFVDLLLAALAFAQLLPLSGIAWLIAGTPPMKRSWQRFWIAWVVASIPGLVIGAIVSGLLLFMLFV